MTKRAVYARTGNTNRWSELMQYVIFNQIHETLLYGSWRLTGQSDMWMREKLCGNTRGQTIDVHFEWLKRESDSSCYRPFVSTISINPEDIGGRFLRNVVGGGGHNVKTRPSGTLRPVVPPFRRTVLPSSSETNFPPKMK